MGTCAPALVAYKNEWNGLFPQRDKASDGCCAGAAHSLQNPTSDHEPNKFGICRAFDLDEDIGQSPSGLILPLTPPGKPLWWLWLAIAAKPDKRIKYVIYERGIMWPNSKLTADPARPETWGSAASRTNPRQYAGKNAHDHHLHLSVWDNPVFYDDTSNWLDKWILPVVASKLVNPTFPTLEVAQMTGMRCVEFPEHKPNADPASPRFGNIPVYVLDIANKKILGYNGGDFRADGVQYDLATDIMWIDLNVPWIEGDILDMSIDPKNLAALAVYTSHGKKYSFPSKY